MQPGQDRYHDSRTKLYLALSRDWLRTKEKVSVHGLMEALVGQMSVAKSGFDWIYVDVPHEPDDMFLDGELAWRLATIFDDYGWDTQPKVSCFHPKRGIEAFLNLYKCENWKLAVEGQYQMDLQKTT
jgi:hypothetical protein